MDLINSEYEDYVKCLDGETSMHSTISELNNRRNMLEQQSSSNNIELQCVPESKTENVVSLVMNLSRLSRQM